MSENINFTLLKVTLILFSIMAVIYGIVYIFFTEAYIENSGSEPIHPSWLRWFGGIFLALAHGAVLVLRNACLRKSCFVSSSLVGQTSS